jgi:hypothetical protein
VNRSFKSEKPGWRTNPLELFRACYHTLFEELDGCTDRARKKEVKTELKRLARRAGVQLGRTMK